MHAEALVGKVLGNWILQRVLSQGTMGAVYLAQQSRSDRQGAIKVFLRLPDLEPLGQLEFLQGFKDELYAVATLNHPNILAIYDYGTYDGLAYIVTPYVQERTLDDVLKQEGALSFSEARRYLEQIASALDYAHAREVIHRDLKPANILLHSDGKLLVTDFGISRLVMGGKAAAMRLSRPDMLDYMPPEQVLSKKLDERSDIYSLGAILYRMVAGVPPFQGKTLMEVVTKHVKETPRSPASLRPELPEQAAQVILTALAKQPEKRYASAKELSAAFRSALSASGTLAAQKPASAPLEVSSIEPTAQQVQQGKNPVSHPRGLSKPRWQAPAVASVAPASQEHENQPTGQFSFSSPAQSANLAGVASMRPIGKEAVANIRPPVQNSLESQMQQQAFPVSSQSLPQQTSSAMPRLMSTPAIQQPSASMPRLNLPEQPVDQIAASQQPQAGQTAQLSPDTTGSLNRLGMFNTPGSTGTTGTFNPLSSAGNTGALDKLGTVSNTGTFKLTGPARIVTIPVAGQPGRYVTGILPTVQQASAPTAELPAPPRNRLLGQLKMAGIALLVLLVAFASVAIWLTHQPSQQATNSRNNHTMSIKAAGTPNVHATVTANALATVNANTILFDPLSQNIHNWPVSNTGPVIYAFKDGAYHITNNDSARVAPAVLPGEILKQPFAYTLTMEEIRGDDTNINNEFGMIVRFTSQMRGGKLVTTFYTFEVLNRAGGEYQFWKYDDSQQGSPWTELNHRLFGHEYHQGQGPNSINTFKIVANGSNFTLIVNGSQVWTVSDRSFSSGDIGMLVNLKGTEVAFSNLRLTYN